MPWPNNPAASQNGARATAILAAAIVLAACTTVGPNFNTPAGPAAAGYAMAGDARPAIAELTPRARAAGPWWRSLGSADLDAVMVQALAGNQTLAAADATLEKARDEAAKTRGAGALQASASAGAERERINTQIFGIPNFPSPTINLFSVGGMVSYDLDLFGGQKRRGEAGEAAAEAQARRADAAYLTLTGNVALQAVQIAGLRAQIGAVRDIAADDQHNIDIVRAAEAAGGEAPSATTSGVAQLAEDQALMPPLEQELARARHALALLVGKPAADWTAPDFAVADFTPPAHIPLALPSALVRGRPDILAAEADLHADTARIGVATADLYPDIRLVAGLTQSALAPQSLFSFSSTGYNFGAALTAPILNGGALRAEKRAAQAQARASLAQYRQTVLVAFTQVSDVLTALAHDDDQAAALTKAQSTAQAALADARTAYRLGGGAVLPIVQAQRRLDRARLALIQAQDQRLADIVSLYAATATDWRPAPAAPSGS
ncbi:MAG: efflux transporter outer membrane subunit [Caulobacteraceae bacterium]